MFLLNILPGLDLYFNIQFEKYVSPSYDPEGRVIGTSTFVEGRRETCVFEPLETL